LLKEFNIVKNADTPWSCYADPKSNLIYFIHSKCACSFYKWIFRTLGWQTCTVNDIDWDSSLVFSYIRDPLVKQRIGIIEWFYYNHCEHLLEQNFDDDKFFQLLAEIVYIDHHSMSIYEHLGDKSQKIKWIPIDQPDINHKQLTLDLIKQYSTITEELELRVLDAAAMNVSTGFKKMCNEKILNLPVHPLIIKSLEYDQCLYDNIVKPSGFEPEYFQIRVKKLEATGLSNLDAQKVADAEVESGKYLKWNKNV
jgi:hypothetical protein